jgi:POT family proton-dependent oligopeptide transporter
MKLVITAQGSLSNARRDRPAHPRGLNVLVLTEVWERFSFYGMRALVLLYSVRGLGFTETDATRVYAAYMAFVFVAPVLGGLIGDSAVGYGRSALLGAVLMMAGHLLMTFTHRNPFFAGLALVALGCGLFKPNVNAMLARLYATNDSRREQGFLICYIGIHVGAIMAPIVCGWLAERVGYRAGFASAAAGMAAAIVVLGAGWAPANRCAEEVGAPLGRHTPELRRGPAFAATLIVCAFAVLFWIASEQMGSSLTFFAEHDVDRSPRWWPGAAIPTGYFLALNPLGILVLMPIISRVWQAMRRRGREPTTARKLAIGFVLMTLSYGALVAVSASRGAGKIGPQWLVLSYGLGAASELCILPIGMTLITRLTPAHRIGVGLAMWFLAGFVGNLLAGKVAIQWQQWSHEVFFGLLAAVCLFAAIALSWLAGRLDRLSA